MALDLFPPGLWTDVGKLVLASALAGLIGLERRYRAQPAGMRTQMAIAAASCLAMEMTQSLPQAVQGAEPGRVIQAVLTGIGFLGGGAILRTGMSVHGLTTAATIWGSATIGLAVGAGLPMQAIALTALIAGGLLVLAPIEEFLTRRRELRKIVVEAQGAPDLLDQVETRLRDRRIRLDEVGMVHNAEQRRVTLNLVAACPEKLSCPELVSGLIRIPGVTEVRIE